MATMNSVAPAAHFRVNSLLPRCRPPQLPCNGQLQFRTMVRPSPLRSSISSSNFKSPNSVLKQQQEQKPQQEQQLPVLVATLPPTSPMFTMPVNKRRLLLSSLLLGASQLLLQPLLPAALADPSRLVRLKDVDNAALQSALRAAVAGDLEAAEQQFSALLLEFPQSASLWSNRGSVLLSQQRFQEAVADLTRAVELAPTAAVPFLNRAIAFEALGQLSEAERDCKAAIANDDKEAAAWFNLGNVKAKQGDYEASLESYKTASLLAPGVAGYRLRVANILFQLNSTKEAESVMRALVRKYPSYYEARAALAALLWKKGRVADAEEQLYIAVGEEKRLKDAKWVQAEFGWPSKVSEAYERFLNLS